MFDALFEVALVKYVEPGALPPTTHSGDATLMRFRTLITELCRNQVLTGTTHIFGLKPLPSHVYFCRNRHPKIAQIYGCICLFHYFYALNFRHSASITELCRIQVHTGTPHICCLTTTSPPVYLFGICGRIIPKKCTNTWDHILPFM